MNATASSFSMTVILNSPQMQKKKKRKSGILSDMDWPPHSPDYNITEALWDQTENRKKTTTNQRTALNVFQEAWRTIPEETRRKIAKEHTGRMELITRIADFKTH